MRTAERAAVRGGGVDNAGRCAFSTGVQRPLSFSVADRARFRFNYRVSASEN